MYYSNHHDNNSTNRGCHPQHVVRVQCVVYLLVCLIYDYYPLRTLGSRFRQLLLLMRRRLIAVMMKKGSSTEVIPMYNHGRVSILINQSVFLLNFVRMSMVGYLTLALPWCDGIYKQKHISCQLSIQTTFTPPFFEQYPRRRRFFYIDAA